MSVIPTGAPRAGAARPRHRAAPASHRTAWVTVAAVAVAFLAGTAMATLDRSMEQASPGEGSSVGESASPDGPRTLFPLDPLGAAVSDGSPDTQPAFTVANALVAMNSDEAAATMQGDEGKARQAMHHANSPLVVHASATPAPRDPAVPHPDGTVLRTGDQSPVSPPPSHPRPPALRPVLPRLSPHRLFAQLRRQPRLPLRYPPRRHRLPCHPVLTLHPPPDQTLHPTPNVSETGTRTSTRTRPQPSSGTGTGTIG